MKIHQKFSRSISHPERVLQFGTGVLLRGLCDFAIHKANKSGKFKGSVVVVKSTGKDVTDFSNQENLYTVCVRGIHNGKLVEENEVVECISRVLAAETDWQAVLETAKDPKMDVVVSNTTEAGLVYEEEDYQNGVPNSFPGKLLAWLKSRYEARQKGVVIIPTELVVDNGSVLKEIVHKLLVYNQAKEDFANWVLNENHFCSSLVDRIVPGRPNQQEHKKLEETLGYEDALLIKCEYYKLWAIQGSTEIAKRLSFCSSTENILVAKDISQYRELKLRMLNASHTLMCGLSFLSGFTFVKDTLKDSHMEKYMTILMLTELAPSIPKNMDSKLVQRYGREVLDRFRNPYLEHKWISITLQYTLKMKSRVVPLISNYYSVFNTTPHYLARCFAAYLLFMKCAKNSKGEFEGSMEGTSYLIHCDHAPYFESLWSTNTSNDLVLKVLSNKDLWGVDLNQIPAFTESVSTHLQNMLLIGVKEVASTLNVYA